MKEWGLIKTGKHSSKLTWQDDGIFGHVSQISETTEYECPRGHTFKTSTPIVIAVDDDPNYNSGPICSYCYVDWFKLNLNAKEANSPWKILGSNVDSVDVKSIWKPIKVGNTVDSAPRN